MTDNSEEQGMVFWITSGNIFGKIKDISFFHLDDIGWDYPMKFHQDYASKFIMCCHVSFHLEEFLSLW